MINIQDYISRLKEKLNLVTNKTKLIEVKNIFVKNEIAPLYKEVAHVENKKEFGQKLNELKLAVEKTFNNYFNNLLEKDSVVDEQLDFSFTTNSLQKGSLHILNKTLDEMINFFKHLNFEIVSGNEIVTDEFNFHNLNIPKNHPARNSQNSLFINEKYLLKTQCTATTAEKIYLNKNDDIRIVSYGNVYRNDDDDATHSHQFMQLDIVWINKDMNISNLKWLIDSFLKYLFNSDIKTRYRLSYFPFTEPSFEVDVSCFKCDQKGCNICKHTGWIEILGAGLLNINVLDISNIKDKIGLAAGIGVERIAMLKYGITDIREFYTNNFAFNKQFKK